jgi:hypothetical protein
VKEAAAKREYVRQLLVERAIQQKKNKRHTKQANLSINHPEEPQAPPLITLDEN